VFAIGNSFELASGIQRAAYRCAIEMPPLDFSYEDYRGSANQNVSDRQTIPD
jgi:hypothetical protein